ncbi:MAG: N-acetyltransferase [Lachnospiraceae bacterium]
MIRQAKMIEIETIMGIYETAREYMRTHGNPTQWGTTEPLREWIVDDIEKGDLYVIEEEGELHGVFYFIIGKDKQYSVIDGAWLNDDTYGVIHRVASDGSVKGLVSQAVAFCFTKINNLRIDTHADNVTMQRAVERLGFHKCGIVYMQDNTERIAYQKLL